MKKTSNYFVAIRSGIKSPKPKTVESQDKPKFIIKQKDSDQTHVVLGVRTFDVFNEKRFVLDVLSDILGGGMSSRLFQRVREEMGAAYYVRSDTELLLDHGYFAASFGVNNDRLLDSVRAVIEEFKKLKEEQVSKEELQRAQDHLIGNMMVNLETSDDLARFYGGQEIMTGSVLSPKEFEERIRAVTLEEIKDLAGSTFQNSKLNLAAIGPVKDREALQKELNLD